MFQYLKKTLNKTRQKKPVSEGGKLNKNFSKSNKKFVKDFTASGFKLLTK